LSGAPDDRSVNVSVWSMRPVVITTLDTYVEIGVNLEYALAWVDGRHQRSECRLLLAKMLSLSVHAAKQDDNVDDYHSYAGLYWLPNLEVAGREHLAVETSARLKSTSFEYDFTTSIAQSNYSHHYSVIQTFDYTWYPFDVQKVFLEMTLVVEQQNNNHPDTLAVWGPGSCDGVVETIRAVAAEEGLALGSEFRISGSIEDAVTRKEEYEDGYSQCMVQLLLRRNAFTFLVKRLIGDVVITETGMLSLGLNPMNPPLMGTRFVMQVITMLIAITRMSADLGLGDLNYLIWTDFLAILQLIVILLAITENLTVHYLIRGGSEYLAIQLDREMRVVLPLLLPCWYASMILLAFSRPAGIVVFVLTTLLLSGGVLAKLKLGQRRRRRHGRRLLSELSQISMGKLGDADSRSTLEQIFDHYDTNHNGDISKAEMRTVLHATVPAATRKQVQEALEKAPFVNNVLSKDDFVQSVDDCIVQLNDIAVKGHEHSQRGDRTREERNAVDATGGTASKRLFFGRTRTASRRSGAACTASAPPARVQVVPVDVEP